LAIKDNVVKVTLAIKVILVKVTGLFTCRTFWSRSLGLFRSRSLGLFRSRSKYLRLKMEIDVLSKTV
jgi:hypothetical protein